MKPVKGLFFDLDGTLLDTADDFVVVVNRMLSDSQRPPLPDWVIRQNVSHGSRQLMKMAFSVDGTEPEQKREEFLAQYDQLIQDEARPSSATPYQGMEALIHEAESRNISWGIITNKPRPYAEILVDQHLFCLLYTSPSPRDS